MEFIRKNVNASSGGTSNSSGGISQSTSSNVSTLATHTIFGQPYNGTNDVRGDLSDVSKITANGDVSTDSKFIIKEVDDDSVYTGKDMQISKENSTTQFEGGEAYHFDAEITAPRFNGDVKAETVETAILNADDLNANEAETKSLTANLGNITNLISDDATIDTLTVTKAAHFFSLIIDEIKSVGGQVIISPASATLDIVKKTDSGNYKCYFQSKVGNDRVSNQFAPNDQVVCQTFNVAEGTSYDVSNTFYWRLLTSRGKETVDNVEYHYIILSGTDCADGSGEPKVGDKVVALGNRNTKDRQNAIVLSAYNSDFLDKGLKAPSLVQYSGITDYTLTTHRQNVISNGLNQFIGNFSVSTGEAITDLIDANKYNRLILDKATAVVGADDIMKLNVSGSVIPVSDKKYTVEIVDSSGTGNSVSLSNNTFSYSKEVKNYSATTITYYTVILKQDGTTIEKVNVPVIFETGAVLSVMDDKIESAVQGLEGEISKVEQKADSITTTVQNMKIGGRNLLDDSEFSTYASGSTWTVHNGVVSANYGYKGQLGVHTICKPSTVNSDNYLDLAQQEITLKLEPDTYYTLSFYAKGANGQGIDNGGIYRYKGRVTTFVYPEVGTEYADNHHTFTTTSKWQRYSYTFKTLSTVSPTNTYRVLFRLIADTTSNNVTYYSNTYICMPKLEEGTMATAWDSNNVDMKSYISQKADSIEAKIVSEDTVKSLISQNGSQIKAEVYDEIDKATGINITNGSITLNADKTTINGNLSIRNADEGVVLYDTDGNAKVMLLNKKIPTIDNLDTSQSQMVFMQNFAVDTADEDFYEFDSNGVNVGTFKVGDTLTLNGSSLLLISNNSKKIVELNDSTYITYNYYIYNKTTKEGTYSTTYTIKTTGSWDTSGNVLNGLNYTIKTAGSYQVVLVVNLYNPDRTTDYTLGWLFFTAKTVTDYTFIGTDGLVSVKGENQYLYYGDDGFIVRGYDYSGLRIKGSNFIDTVVSAYNGKPLWGNLNSNLRVVGISNNLPSMTVKAGTTTIGTRYVVRADSDYYNADMIVLKYAAGETWIKLPPPYNVDGTAYSALLGKCLKIKNLTSQRCYMYCEDAGYKIYTPDDNNSANYWEIGNQSVEVMWTGSEWIWFRGN